MVDTQRHGFRAPTRDEVIAIVGTISENKIAALLASGARAEDLLDAVAMAKGDIDIAATGESAVSPLAVQAYEILTN